ncbi:MAG: hypothetical protein COU07_01025 [Candidatus Harrisonbacteria bacterium CG10_big_fil_rev_8_21_14_0_10_40_38]|uniref:Uncharacterized protein n=1 Tax=Candidatus Harrisonbacteria bacterium CG10_big_fil_rev_8_21_14_0_10_40_38 TaxID=1974583 RepID=A0A2H0USU7_9BACT|nr:MAG: hypothetical protein COU07_01025 [Candidatus Harrisonbacteria bacterium CG10_big_fil_rev_8_21_14_0_10_40_38]
MNLLGRRRSDALRIFGSERYLSANEVASVYGQEGDYGLFKPPTGPNNIRLMEACARENEENGCDWRVVYCLPFSVRVLISNARSFQPNLPTARLPYFINQPTSDSWAISEPPSGYKLIDFAPRFVGYSWDVQENLRRNESRILYRAELAHVAQALVSFRHLRGEILLNDNSHWSATWSEGWKPIYIGDNENDGWVIDSWDEDDSDGYLGICVTIPFVD